MYKLLLLILIGFSSCSSNIRGKYISVSYDSHSISNFKRKHIYVNNYNHISGEKEHYVYIYKILQDSIYEYDLNDSLIRKRKIKKNKKGVLIIGGYTLIKYYRYMVFWRRYKFDNSMDF